MQTYYNELIVPPLGHCSWQYSDCLKFDKCIWKSFLLTFELFSVVCYVHQKEVSVTYFLPIFNLLVQSAAGLECANLG
jgi:hypothetical protein